MKKNFVKAAFMAALMLAATQLPACKGKDKTNNADTATNTTAAPADTTPTAPVVVAEDSKLKTDVTDATKDFPGVTASVDSGVVTLTGNITRDKLQRLMMNLNALHPKKINNNLTISK
ncbi:hypothetical protein DYU05_07325 [Mucilaginibacter terrenus]|uniref:BON domain-containing protein n=1 Tax=Mucilaginibacter terrenus TaxID=2482727 RepID=A0A3E2NX14_9SPHI|nr:hypothetical protein [Mucilaginibacter terrenus]RFZ85400.1 hypothetical protein DYU05_07325 [Mucilaginibacter terrenus]